MALRIIRPNLPPVVFETDARLVVLAGPNGVGKSTLLAELGTEYLDRRKTLSVAQPHIASNDVRLSPHLIIVERLSEYKLLVSSGSGRPDIQSFGLAYGDFEQALSDADDSTLSPQALEMRRRLTPEERSRASSAPSEVETLYRTYFTRLLPSALPLLSQSFQAYHEEYAARRYSGRSAEDVRHELGDPPWNKAQRFLDQIGLPYTIRAPDIDHTLPKRAQFILTFAADGRNVPGDRLSSGERVALAIYDIIAGTPGVRRIFLLDDVDALLHPPLLRSLLRALLSFLEENDCYCLWVTHSPVFVQLADHAAFFYLERYGGTPRPISRVALIEELTAGELVVSENLANVFAEGRDPSFYQGVFHTMTRQGAIVPQRQVRFASPRANATGADANCHAVNEIVGALDRCGYGAAYQGLVDRDDERLQLHPNVRRLGRYCKENYLFDPLNVYGFLIGQDMHVDQLIRFDAYGLSNAHELTSALSVQQLQQVVDHLATAILGLQRTPDNEELVAISRGIALMYPRELLYTSGKTFQERHSQYSSRLNVRTLEIQFLRGNFFPEDLRAVMEDFGRLRPSEARTTAPAPAR